MRRLWRLQQEHDVNIPINLNLDYAAFVEQWALGTEWDELVEGTDISEGKPCSDY